MTKMLQMYATKEFSNGCDLWLAGICRYLNDAYTSLASDLLGQMAEVSMIVYHYTCDHNHLFLLPSSSSLSLIPTSFHSLLPFFLSTPLSRPLLPLSLLVSSLHTQMLEKGQPLYHRPILRLLYHYLRLQDPNSHEMREIGGSIMTIVSQHIQVGGGNTSDRGWGTCLSPVLCNQHTGLLMQILMLVTLTLRLTKTFASLINW